MAALSLAACDDSTDTLGLSVINTADKVSVSATTFHVSTESLATGAVLNNSNRGLLGEVKDPETGAYVEGSYMSQVIPLSTFTINKLDSIKLVDDRGKLEADSCFLLVSYTTAYGDTLAPMKVTAYEMKKPLSEDRNYYSDFDVEQEGYLDKTTAYHSSVFYNVGKSEGAFKIYLNKPYTKDGVRYENYGSYIMQMYEKHPEYFKSNYDFLHYVCPGFYIEHDGGIGNVANVWNTEIQFWYRWKLKDPVKKSDGVTDSITCRSTFARLDGTEEVLQTNFIKNDQNKISSLVNDESCTYIKSPAGILTVATLPVEDIMKGHENDTLNAASITFPRMNNSQTEVSEEYAFDVPSTILMIPRDSLTSFFEHGNLPNYRTSYTSSYSNSSTNRNSYSFTNISNLITAMYQKRKSSTDWERDKNTEAYKYWNQVVLIPVTISYTTRDGYQYVSRISHDMWLTSTKLMKNVELKATYSKFGNNTEAK